VVAFGHYVLPINSSAASKISKAPGTTRSNANLRNGVMCTNRTRSSSWTMKGDAVLWRLSIADDPGKPRIAGKGKRHAAC
jgi:hypothetical protein